MGDIIERRKDRITENVPGNLIKDEHSAPCQNRALKTVLMNYENTIVLGMLFLLVKAVLVFPFVESFPL